MCALGDSGFGGGSGLAGSYFEELGGQGLDLTLGGGGVDPAVDYGQGCYAVSGHGWVIEQLNTVAALGAGVRLEDLVRDARLDDAQALATVDAAAAEYDALAGLRNGILWPKPGYLAAVLDGWDATTFRDPTVAAHYGDLGGSRADYLLGVIRAGGVLWFPTLAEAIDAAEPIVARQRADAEKLAALQRQQGRLGALMID